MHAVAAMLLQRDVFDDEIVCVRKMHAERLALPHGDILHRDAADVLQQDDAVGAESGIHSGRPAEEIYVRLVICRGESGPDAACNGDVGIERQIGGHGLRVQGDDVLVAHHAGVGAGLEANLGVGIGGKFLTRPQGDGTIQVVRLIALRQMHGVGLGERRLDGVVPDLGSNRAFLDLTGVAWPFLGPGIRPDELFETSQRSIGIAVSPGRGNML